MYTFRSRHAPLLVDSVKVLKLLFLVCDPEHVPERETHTEYPAAPLRKSVQVKFGVLQPRHVSGKETLHAAFPFSPR